MIPPTFPPPPSPPSPYFPLFHPLFLLFLLYHLFSLPSSSPPSPSPLPLLPSLFSLSFSSSLFLHLSPAPPGQVDNTTVNSRSISLNRTRLTWVAPESNNALITNYEITYCFPSNNDNCMGQTNTSVRGNPAVPMVDLTVNPQRRYRVTIRAENAAGRGPESGPYSFDSPTAGRCC